MKGQYTKLFLIGNGFDRWQGLPTSYDNFRQYYFEHILEISKQLRIKTEVDKAGNIITPVEKIFGDIFNPKKLPGEFFWNFESSMALLDDQNIALYFGKSYKGVYQMQETLNAALEILRKVFGDWIKSISIEDKETGYRFDDSCYFINFNYTNTLEKRFQVDERIIYMEISQMRNRLCLVILSIQKLLSQSLWNKNLFIELAETRAKG